VNLRRIEHGADSVALAEQRRGATAAQVALAWLLTRYERMLLIPGTASVAHLEENLAAIDLALDEHDLATLATVGSRGDLLASREA
jgi:pyridoxine 4-dehydrogenase